VISDVLFDALQEIERYQREFPEVYSDMADDIDAAKQAMRRLQASLDNSPSPAADAIVNVQ
jgi:hypothetical protein